MKACGREKRAPLENWTICPGYLKGLKSIFDNPSTIGNHVRMGIKPLCSDTLKKKKKRRNEANAQMVELGEEQNCSEVAAQAIASVSVRVSLRLHITNSESVYPFDPSATENHNRFCGFGWSAVVYTCKSLKSGLPLSGGIFFNMHRNLTPVGPRTHSVGSLTCLVQKVRLTVTTSTSRLRKKSNPDLVPKSANCRC